MKKRMRFIIAIIVVVIVGIILVHTIYMAKEHTLDLQLLGSYSIDTNNIRMYTGVKENASFTYFLKIDPGSLTLSGITSYFKDNKLDVSDDLPDIIISSNENRYVLLSIGRELKEVKYKYLKRYSDGEASIAQVTFGEEYQGEVIYVYIMNKQLFFMGEDYYIMDGDEEVFLGNNIRLINEAISK